MLVITNVKGERAYFAPQHVAVIRNKRGSSAMAEIVMVNGEIVEIDKDRVERTVKRIEEGI